MPYQGNARIYVGSSLIWSPDWPTPSYTLGTASAVTVTASGSNNTYGSWVELVSSTANATDILSVLVVTLGSAGVASGSVLSIGTGGSGSEVELFAIPVGSHVTTNAAVGDTSIPVPVHIATGTRIAARLQCETGGTAATVRLSYSAVLATPYASAVDVLGTSLVTSRGVNMPTNNTYVEVTASTARAYQGLILVPSSAGGTQASESSLYTVGIGAAAAEVTFGSGTVVTTTSEQLGIAPSSPPLIFMGHVPAGSRIACKQSVGRNYRDVAVIGIRYP